MKKITAILIYYFLISTNSLFAQDSLSEKKSPFSFNTDFVTSFVWRGLQINDSPDLQPNVSFSKGGFECGSWGSISFNGEYSELDLYASYTLNKFKFSAADYYILSDNTDKNYFDYAKNTTAHAFEASLAFTVSEKVPLTLLATTFFYGSDCDSLGNNYYSSYFEASYSFDQVDIYIGMSPWESMYGNKPGIVNVGLTFNKEIVITDKYSIPAYLSLIANPMNEKFMIVAGFTF